MAWTVEDTAEEAVTASASIDLVFSGTATDDEEIYLGLWLTDADLTDITQPSGFTLIADYLEANRTLGLYHKTAASEGSATYTFSHSSTATMAGVGLAYSGETHGSAGTEVTAVATSTDTLSVGPVTGATGDLMLALFYYSNNGVPTFTGGFTEQKRAPTKLSFADKTSAGTADTAINTLSKSVTRQSAILINIAPAGAGGAVDVTDVDTDEVLVNGQQNVVTGGTNFEAAQGAGTMVLINGAITSAFTIDSWADTSIQGDLVQGNVPFTTASYAVSVKVTNDSASTDSLLVTFNPEDDTAVIELLNPTEGDGQVDITGTPATADLYHHDDILYLEDGTTPTAYTVSIDATGKYSFSGPPAGTYKFKVRHWNQTDWDVSDISLGTVQTVIITEAAAVSSGPHTKLSMDMILAAVSSSNEDAVLNFDGSSIYGELTDPVTFTGDFEIHIVFQLAPGVSGDRAFAADASADNDWFRIDATNGSVDFKYNSTFVSGDGSFTPDTDTHTAKYALVGGILTSYYDGVYVAHGGVTPATITLGLVGRRSSGTANYFDGQIKSIKFIDKSGASDVIDTYQINNNSTTSIPIAGGGSEAMTLYNVEAGDWS